MIKMPKGSSSRSMASGGVRGGHGEGFSYLWGGGHCEFNHASVHKLNSEIYRGREHTVGRWTWKELKVSMIGERCMKFPNN